MEPIKKELLREILRTEIAIENLEGHIQWMLRNGVDHAHITRAKTETSELKAYLRGLRFQTGGVPIGPEGSN